MNQSRRIVQVKNLSAAFPYALRASEQEDLQGDVDLLFEGPVDGPPVPTFDTFSEAEPNLSISFITLAIF